MLQEITHPESQLKKDKNNKSQTKKSARKVQGSYSKTDARYWLRPGRLKKYRGSSNYSFQVQFKRRRHSFSTGVPNLEAAAKIAARINLEFIQDGIQSTYDKYRPKSPRGDRVATVGQWIDAAYDISDVAPKSFNSYAASLRLIVAQIVGIKHGKERFGPKKGGASNYRQAVDAVSLEVLSMQNIQKWKLAYIAGVKKNQAPHSRKNSCTSTMRQAKALFSDNVIKFLPNLKLPDPKPFEGVDSFARQNVKYHSKIDAKALLIKAQTELSLADVPVFIAMLLAFGAGLRRSEIDALKWSQIDCDRAVVRVETGKTHDSRGEVPVDEAMAGILRGYKAKAKAEGFVIVGDGKDFGSKTWGQHYRANAVFERLTAWLRANGVNARKPIHELRKELGSLVTDEHGIYAASRVLRHSTVATTATYYTDLKKRPTIGIGGWLMPENVTSMQTSEKKALRK